MTSALDAPRASDLESLQSLPSDNLDALFTKNSSTKSNFSSYDVFPTLLSADPVCDRNHYGENLDRTSCDEALEKIGSTMTVFTVAQRGSPYRPFIKLPNRWSSLDSKCVIDLTIAPGSVWDVTFTAQIKAAAQRVIETCIPAVGRTEGGSIAEIGTASALIVVVRKYEPSVTCGGLPPPIGSCSRPISLMPASGNRLLFGYRHSLGVQVPLPRSYRAAGSRCVITVSTSAVTVYSAWFDLWGAAVAVDTLCVSHGQLGVADGIGEGEHGGLKIELRPVRSPEGDEE